MRGFFEPETVAVVGVSNSLDNLGVRISLNLDQFGFKGTVHEVGPKGGTIFNRPIYPSIADIPGRVDLAVLLTPAAVVPEVMEECGRMGVRRVVVESGGFSESGEEGRRLASRVKEVASRWGIRFIGPNGLGVINRRLGLATAFGMLDPAVPAGGISVLSQSGGVMLGLLHTLTSEGLGVAKVVSMGNKLDVDENDLLEYLIDDPETQVVCMYLEGISDGRRLMEIARRSAKPILVHKANTGLAARRIASSHTAALADDDRVVEAALRQTGVARCRSPEAMVHHLKALALPPLRGNRLVVLSRSGGHAVITADECELNGFELARCPRTSSRGRSRPSGPRWCVSPTPWTWGTSSTWRSTGPSPRPHSPCRRWTAWCCCTPTKPRSKGRTRRSCSGALTALRWRRASRSRSTPTPTPPR
jgi:acyl-CoA synthetase (NDP forming)